MDLKPLVLKIRDLVLTSRLLLLPKTFLIMFFGAFAALNGFPRNILLFLAGFLAIGPLLWAGLYSLGNYFDIETDKLDHRKKDRPLVKGTLRETEILVWSVVFALSGLITAYTINIHLFFVAIGMVISQILYSAPGFRLKEKLLGDIALVAIINPTLRFLAGWFLFSRSLAVPLFPLIFLWSLHLMGEFAKDLLNREFEKKAGYQSTAVVLGKRRLYWGSMAAYFAALLTALAMCISGLFKFKYVTPVPCELVGLILLSLAMSPYLFKVIREPEKYHLDDVRLRGWTFVCVVLVYVLVVATARMM